MAGKATIGDLITPLRSMEACLKESNEILTNGLTSVWEAVDDLNGDVMRALRTIERKIHSLEKNAKGSATDKAAKGGIMGSAAKTGGGGKSSKFGDFAKTAEAFSPQNLAAGVKAVSDIKLKDFLTFPRKMHYAAEGMMEPIRVMKYNHGMKPTEIIKWSAAINKLGNATREFLKDIRKSLLSAKVIELLSPKDVTKSGLFKATEMVATAIMCNIYGARYNKRTKTFTGGNFKRALELQRGAKVLKKLGKDILVFDAILALTAVVAPVALVGVAITALVIKTTTWVFRLLGDRRQVRELERGGKALMYMATGILTFELGIVLAAIVAPFAMIALGMITPLVVGSVALFSMLGSKKTVWDVKNAAWAVTLMGLSLIVFTASLVVSALILKAFILPDGKFDGENLAALAMTIPVFGLMMGALWVFNKIGSVKNVNNSMKALVAIAAISIGLIIFSAALYISNAMTKDLWKNENGELDPAAMVTTVAVFGLMVGSIYAFNLAGKQLANVAKGTVSVVLMGIGLALFGIGVGFYMNAIKDSSWGDIGKAAALIGIFGAEFIILGVAFSLTALGSAAVGLMAVALGVFGFGVSAYMESIEETGWETVGKAAGILGIFGLEFTALGFASPFIAAADIAVGCMGVALGSFAKGLKPFAEVFEDVKPEVIIKGAKILGALSLEFAAIGVASILIAPAGKAIGIMGESLVSLGKGLRQWIDAGATRTDIDDLCYAIDRIKLIFLGQKDGDKNKGFFGRLGSAISGAISSPFDNATIENTARGLRTAGVAINELSKGLRQWVDADIRVEDMANMTTIIGTIGETFQRLGEKKQNGNNEGSLLRRLIGIDFRGLTKTDMELGIRSVEGLGKALTDISQGLVDWRDKMGKEFEGEKLVKLANDIAAVVGALGTAFAAVASDENTVLLETTNTSSFATVMGETFGSFTKQEYKNRVQMGIEAVKGLGTELVGIADGMDKMTKIAVDKLGTMPTIDMKTWSVSGGSGAMKATAEVLVAMGHVFSEIGEQIQKQGMYEEIIEPAKATKGNWFTDDTYTAAKTEKRSYIGLAISSLMGIGDIVSGIANALNTMSQIKNTGNIDKTYDILLQVVDKTIMTFTRIGEEIEGKHTGTVSAKVGGKTISVQANNTKSFLENVGLIVKMTKDAKDVMTAMPEMVKTLNKNKGEFENFIKNGDDNILYALSNAFTIVSAMSGAAREEGEVGSRLLYNWYDEKGNTVDKAFTWLNKGAIKNAKTNADNIILFFDSIGTALGKLPKEKVNTEILQEAIVGAGTDVVYINAWLNEDEIATAKTNVGKMDELIVSANTMLGKVPLELKLLSDLREANDGGAVAFDVLFSNITNSIRKLNGQDDRIESTTKLISTLANAKKSGVFSDLSSNVDKMVRAINSLDGEKLKPYADMIMALRDMSTENSKFKELFEEMIKLLAEIIEKIKENGIEGTGSERSNNTNNRTNAYVPQVNAATNNNNAALGDLTTKIETLLSTLTTGTIEGTKTNTGSSYTITFRAK